MDQEPTEDVLTWACYWESCGCCGFFACLFLPAAVSYFSRFLILHTWTVFQIVLDGIIGQTIHFACVPKFLHILKVKLIWRQFEYNGGCTDLFLWEMIPFEGQGVAGPALIKEGNTLPIQVSYHTRNLSSSSVLLENSYPQTSLPENRFQYKLLVTGRQPHGIFPLGARAGRHSCGTEPDTAVLS